MSERIGVMSEGRLLQVGTPREIYERPSSRFVADFIGRTNLIEATVESTGTVRLANGVVIEAETPAPPGSQVAVSLRPERIRVQPRGAAGADGGSLDGEVGDVTYLGHAVVYSVAAGPTSIEVRSEGEIGEPFAAGDEVTVSWDRGAAAVIAE